MRALMGELARYNAWANQRLYDACGALDSDAYLAPRPSFFGSIHRTLCHILVADRIWLGRMQGAPPAYRLDEELFSTFEELWAARVIEDARLIEVVDDVDLDATFHYQNSRGQSFTDTARAVLPHVFNHQTHHRGQAHGLLSHAGAEPPALDLIFYRRAR